MQGTGFSGRRGVVFLDLNVWTGKHVVTIIPACGFSRAIDVAASLIIIVIKLIESKESEGKLLLNTAKV